MVTRPTDEQHDGRREEGRFGRLRHAIVQGHQVRCACERCGAHLFAIHLGAGRYDGVCRVCGGDRVKPVH